MDIGHERRQCYGHEEDQDQCQKSPLMCKVTRMWASKNKLMDTGKPLVEKKVKVLVILTREEQSETPRQQPLSSEL